MKGILNFIYCRIIKVSVRFLYAIAILGSSICFLVVQLFSNSIDNKYLESMEIIFPRSSFHRFFDNRGACH